MEDGDKGTTKHCQKGVCARRTSQEDCIFSEQTGISPDVMCAPLGIISRMTMGSLIEALTGKAVSLSGNLDAGVDKQLFNRGNNDKIKENMEILKKHGFSPRGVERFRDGRTGELLEGHVFCGVVDFFRLLQLSRKKIHARDIGSRDLLTRQPSEGRRKGGGLRCGQMEGAALSSHGSAHILQARFKQWSDAFDIHVCARCKLPADGNERINYSWCRLCRSNEKVRRVSIPFTFLLTMWELMSMGIAVRIALAESDIPHDERKNRKISIDTREHWLRLYEEQESS